MENQKKSAIVRFPVILLAVSVFLQSASPCAALEVPLPGGETTLDVDYPINEWVTVNTGGTLNLLDGGVINGVVGVEDGGTLNIEGGQVNGDVYVASGSEVNIKGGDIEGFLFPWDITVEAEATVTVFGTDFDVTSGTIDPSGTYFTPDIGFICLLTGMYGGDAGFIDLAFYVFSEGVHIFLAPPALEVIEVMIDIKPVSKQNNINLKSKGVVPVAVLTTDDFDAATIDPTTAEFAGVEPKWWKLMDVDHDGDDDMMFLFKMRELDLDQDSTEATLTAQVSSGTIISGTDEVKIVSPRCKNWRNRFFRRRHNNDDDDCLE